MYVCILAQDGESVVHRNRPASPDPWLKPLAPDRDHIVMAVECVFTWYGLAARCARAGLPCVLGHALSLQALHGGTAKNDTIDAQKIAVFLRGGLRPPADVSPAAMRAPRDRLRRRTPLGRKRAEVLAPLHTTNRQYTLPAIGKQSASKAPRAGGPARFPAPAVPQRLAGALALIGHDDPWLRDVERSSRTTATPHPAQPLSLRRTVPGIGDMRRVVRRYAIHAIARCPRGQDFLAYGRLGQCTKAAAGTRDGTAGAKLGHAQLTWAFSAAAGRLLRAHPAGHKSLRQLEQKPGAGTALTRLAQQLGRAIYSRFQRPTAFAMRKVCHGSGRGADAPHAALDHHGRRLPVVLGQACVAASLHAEEHRGPFALSLWPLSGPPLRLLSLRARVAPSGRVRPRPRAGDELAHGTRSAPPVPRTVGGDREVSRS